MNRSRWLALSIAFFLLALQVAYFALFKTYRVRSEAMAPTIPAESHVLARQRDDVQRGQTIVFQYPPYPHVIHVKRVIGMPGDTIAIRDNKVIINGKPLDEPYVVHDDETIYPAGASLPDPYRSRDQLAPRTIPPGHYFVMGDNRDRSADSRYWGDVPHANVKGHVVLVTDWKRIWRL